MLLQPNVSETVDDVDKLSEVVVQRLIVGLDHR